LNRIEKTFNQLNKNNKCALIPFITAGDPDISTTEKIIKRFIDEGADIIEIGHPFSDPLADGTVIQESSQRALLNNINTSDIFEMVKRIRQYNNETPLVLMGYFNPIYQYGLKKYSQDAKEAGIDGTIIPDLPMEEAHEWISEAKKNNISNILLIAPTTPIERAKKIVMQSNGFIYYVSIAGITGARTTLPPELEQGLKNIKSITNKPVCVGFGISKPEQVESLSKVSDGIIVGSAIIRILEKNLVFEDNKYTPNENLIEEIGNFIKSLKDAIK
jgi:tryptophan synthase alpha chain